MTRLRGPRRGFGGSPRATRVGEQVQHELGQMLVRGLKDPRIAGLVTITGVELSPDLREGVVYYSVFGGADVRRSTQEGLEAAAGYLKREVAQRLRLRVTPTLRFAVDESIERGDRIERLLREVHEAENSTPPSQPVPPPLAVEGQGGGATRGDASPSRSRPPPLRRGGEGEAGNGGGEG